MINRNWLRDLDLNQGPSGYEPDVAKIKCLLCPLAQRRSLTVVEDPNSTRGISGRPFDFGGDLRTCDWLPPGFPRREASLCRQNSVANLRLQPCRGCGAAVRM